MLRTSSCAQAARVLTALLCSLLPYVQGFSPMAMPSVRHRGGCTRVVRFAVAGNKVRMLAKGKEDEVEADPPQMTMAKRNALAANRLQWGIGGVPSKFDSSGTQGADIPPSTQRLGPELEEAVRQARMRAEARTKIEPGKEGARKAASSQRLQLPGFQLASLGFSGRWKEAGPSYVLYPPRGVKPKAAVHFLGGAFVGAAPHLSYRYILEDIADSGYIIITTPYNLMFNYVDMCAEIVHDSRDAIALVPADLPVIGVGHSCGALMHTLLDVLYPEECQRAANVLVSWNNKPASESIPQFKDVVVPAVNTLLDEGNQASKDLEVFLRNSFEQVERAVEEAVASPFAPLAAETEVLPLTRQGLKIVDQVPSLLQSIKDGDREFIPDPATCTRLIQTHYSGAPTLVVSFNDDAIDESDSAEALLRVAAGAVAAAGDAGGSGLGAEGQRSKEGGAGGAASGGSGGVERVRLVGSHVTPLTPDVFISTPFDSFDPLLPLRRLARQEVLKEVDALSKIVIRFLQSSA